MPHAVVSRSVKALKLGGVVLGEVVVHDQIVIRLWAHNLLS
jgi:hypothetical protein